MYGPYLSAIVGDHALTPPTRHSLGKLLPHQQADRMQARPRSENLYFFCYQQKRLSTIARAFARIWSNRGLVPTCYSLVCLPPTNRGKNLHRLGTPPAFVLSQDQTLNLNSFHHLRYKTFLNYFVVKVQVAILAGYSKKSQL